MRRYSEGLLEGPAEIMGAQPNKLREGRQRDLVGQVLFDIGGDDPLLPRSDPASVLRSDAGSPAIQTCEFMHEQEAERFKIGLIS